QGQTLTEQFIAQGADIIMPVAGPVGLGAAAAAASADGVKLVWVDSDGYVTASEYSDLMLTSVMKGIGAAVEGVITDTLNGGFTNEPYVGTLENEGVGLADYHDFADAVPSELDAKIQEYKEQIISGELVIETPNAPN
ncbi:MAG: BMP family ABC transporter substrate-binding protein, partial [Actinomycetales bacterium]|nr:BMP family ABC transporter substrate-binding protein [Actinomycetales bacterium]